MFFKYLSLAASLSGLESIFFSSSASGLSKKNPAIRVNANRINPFFFIAILQIKEMLELITPKRKKKKNKNEEQLNMRIVLFSLNHDSIGSLPTLTLIYICF